MNDDFTKEEYNFLCQHFALSFTPKVYDLMKKLGYKDVGELVNQVGSFKKYQASERDMLIFQIGNQEEFGYWYPNQMKELGEKYGFTEKEMLELIRDLDVQFGKLFPKQEVK